MGKFKLYTAITLILLLLIIVLQNTSPVETKLLFITITMPRAALLGITMLIGIASGMLLALSLSKGKSGTK